MTKLLILACIAGTDPIDCRVFEFEVTGNKTACEYAARDIAESLDFPLFVAAFKCEEMT